MQVWLFVIGTISALCCLIILFCFNSKTYNPHSDETLSTPTQQSKSPLVQSGLNQQQKSQILLVICAIFFLSLLTTNFKSNKFAFMANKIWPAGEQVVTTYVTDLNDIFYGQNGECQVKNHKNLPLRWKESQFSSLFVKMIKQVSEKNKKTILPSNNQEQQLLVLKSQQRGLGAQYVLSQLTKQICLSKSQKHKTPFIYLDLKQNIQTGQQLLDLMGMNSYESLRKAMCKFSNINIKTQKKVIGSQIIENEVFLAQENILPEDIHPPYLIINNFQQILNTVVFDERVQSVSQKDKQNITSYHGQRSDFTQTVQKIYFQAKWQKVPKYKLFIDLLFNQLIPKCQINVILHTQNQLFLNQLYNKWKQYSRLSFSFEKKPPLDFPLIVQKLKGLNKKEFLKLFNEFLISKNTEQHQKTEYFQKIYQYLEQPFENMGQLNMKTIDQQLSFEKIFSLLQKVETTFATDHKLQVTDKNKQKASQDLRLYRQKQSAIQFYAAQYHGLGLAYNVISKSLRSNPANFEKFPIIKKLSIGWLKNKVPLKDVLKLKALGLIKISNGQVMLLN